MACQTYTIKLLTAGADTGDYSIVDCNNVDLSTGLTRAQLFAGVVVCVDTTCTYVTVKSNTVLCPTTTTVYLTVQNSYLIGCMGYDATSCTTACADYNCT